MHHSLQNCLHLWACICIQERVWPRTTLFWSHPFNWLSDQDSDTEEFLPYSRDHLADLRRTYDTPVWAVMAVRRRSPLSSLPPRLLLLDVLCCLCLTWPTWRSPWYTIIAAAYTHIASRPLEAIFLCSDAVLSGLLVLAKLHLCEICFLLLAIPTRFYFYFANPYGLRSLILAIIGSTVWESAA